MRHEDVFKKIMLTGLNRTLDEWLCDSFVELIEEMELWKWDDATRDFWSRLAHGHAHHPYQRRAQPASAIGPYTVTHAKQQMQQQPYGPAGMLG